MSKSRPAAHRPTLLIDVRPAVVSGDLAPRASVPEEFTSRAAEVADGIGEVVDRFCSRLEPVLVRREDSSSWRVGSIEIAFEIAVQAEAGVVIAKTTAGATFSARLTLYAPGEHPA